MMGNTGIAPDHIRIRDGEFGSETDIREFQGRGISGTRTVRRMVVRPDCREVARAIQRTSRCGQTSKDKP